MPEELKALIAAYAIEDNGCGADLRKVQALYKRIRSINNGDTSWLKNPEIKQDVVRT